MNKILWILILWSVECHSNELFPTDAERTFITDRPDKTESPYTLARGRFQFESDVLSLSENWYKGTRTTVVIDNNMALKYGLTKNSDLMMIVPTVMRTTIREKGTERTTKGMGDTILRHRVNLQGNDEQITALGLISYLKLPTAGAGMSNDRVEGGLMFPLTIRYEDIMELAFHIQVDHLRSADDNKGQTDASSAFSITAPLVGKFSAFIELYGKTSDNRTQADVATFDFGFLYIISDGLQIDTGTYLGLTDASEDYATVVGITKRF
ncbi:MAG: transporter [Bdellovibrionota bacterium]